MKNILTILISLIEISCFSQSDTISENGFVIPKTINECIIELDETFTKKAKDKLKSIDEDTIDYINDVFIINEWLNPDSSRLKKYFRSQGLHFEYEMEYFIELSYYKHLTTGNSQISSQIKAYVNFHDSIKTDVMKECESNKLKDTIDGVYIPKDLMDCYALLNKSLEDSIKVKIKSSNSITQFHYLLGIMFKDDRLFWNCSRLIKYFKDNGVRDSEFIPEIILLGYQHYLNDSIYEIEDLIAFIPPPPPEADPVFQVKYTLPRGPYKKKINRFLRKGKIDDFEIGEYSSMR